MLEAHKDTILKDLNKEQLEAVLYNEGPLLILAGAGSGKTRVLTHKIAYLHKEFNVSLNNILAVTFTNKAAREMLNRINNLTDSANTNINNKWILTFHSLAFRVLQRHGERLGYKKGFVIYDYSDQLSMVKRIMHTLDIDTKNVKPQNVLAIISESKNNLIFPEAFTGGNFLRDLTRKIYILYQQELFKNNAMDFDDLLINMLKLLKENDDILQNYQKQFEFIFIDEYQDINLAQYMTAYLLSAKHKKLFVVGDIDQNIYSWRGANLQSILNFEKDFPDAKIILLEQNYRSTGSILKIANKLIQNNKMRKDKNLWTNEGDGSKADIYIANNEYDEAEYISSHIENLLHNKIKAKDIAILYRTNAMSRILEQMLSQKNIKYRIYGGFRFYDRKEIKDILSYLRLIQNEHDDISLGRIINIPPRKIGKITLERLLDEASTNNTSAFATISEHNSSLNLQEFKKTISEIKSTYIEKNLNLGKLIELILEKTNYEKWLKEEDSHEANTRMENIRELIEATQEFSYSLEEFLSLSALMSQQDEPEKTEDTVSLMTLHSAKGLEFDYVFLCGFEENILPHSQSHESPAGLEEERRLCYVGITRAGKKLYISVASQRSSYYSDSKPQSISRFFYELPSEYLTIQISRKVNPCNPIVSALKEGYELDIPISTKSTTYGDKKLSKIALIEDPDFFFDYKIGDNVESPVFGSGVIVKTIGQGKGISLQIRFTNETKLILPKYGKLQKAK